MPPQRQRLGHQTKDHVYPSQNPSENHQEMPICTASTPSDMVNNIAQAINPGIQSVLHSKGIQYTDPSSLPSCTNTQPSPTLVPCTDTRLCYEFYDQPGLELARNLLGCTMVRLTDGGEILEGRVVETEAYLGQEDLCCHSYNKKPTARSKAMFMTPGTAHVYHVYYRYCCFNISCRGDGAVVLIRALEPLKGTETMHTYRSKNLKKQGQIIPRKSLANGPSKLCMALSITKAEFNEIDLVQNERLWLEKGEKVEQDQVISTSRIGLGKHLPEEYRAKPWRFYILNSQSISVRDKVAEASVNK